MRFRHLRRFYSTLLVTVALLTAQVPVHADAPMTDAKPKTQTRDLPVGNLDTKEWLKASTARLEPGEIDRMVSRALTEAKLAPSAKTTDEQFVRRVYLDLTGKLPTPEDIQRFSDDKNADKRAKLVDTLLDSDAYAKHFAKYWREVFGGARLTDFRSRQFQAHFERWLVEQFKANRKWSEVSRDILTASGTIKNDELDKNGQLFFLISRKGGGIL